MVPDPRKDVATLLEQARHHQVAYEEASLRNNKCHSSRVGTRHDKMAGTGPSGRVYSAVFNNPLQPDTHLGYPIVVKHEVSDLQMCAVQWKKPSVVAQSRSWIRDEKITLAPVGASP
jgi:hypothetical protein